MGPYCELKIKGMNKRKIHPENLVSGFINKN